MSCNYPIRLLTYRAPRPFWSTSMYCTISLPRSTYLRTVHYKCIAKHSTPNPRALRLPLECCLKLPPLSLFFASSHHELRVAHTYTLCLFFLGLLH